MKSEIWRAQKHEHDTLYSSEIVPAADVSSRARLLAHAIHDRRDRIRRALIVYPVIAVGKLPPWSNFWQGRQKPWPPTSFDIFKRSLQSLETFDKEA